MARTGNRSSRSAGAQGGVVRARLPEVRLPSLVAYGAEGLEPDGDYDGVLFEETDLADASGPGARFLDCELRGCALDRAELTRSRFIDSVLKGVRGVGTDLSGASLRDVEVLDARLGGVQLHGAVLERVLVRGGKIDYLNLRKARLKDVVFEGCVLSVGLIRFDGHSRSGVQPREDVHHGEYGEEEASPPSSFVHAGVQGRDRRAVPTR
ncbi:pentapeptide repeat-containing protein [Streptomyces sp. NPDC005752]|uniref:pentapeptide repeat-containing protein n=1 Tax=Streptomyces sp. NPDC005752 TaxID=3157065 RepID=UPI00340F122A